MASKQEVLQRFEADGISVAEWARRHGYSYRTVIAVLRGELKGKRGVSHKIAVGLGLKADPSTQRAQ